MDFSGTLTSQCISFLIVLMYSYMDKISSQVELYLVNSKHPIKYTL